MSSVKPDPDYRIELEKKDTESLQRELRIKDPSAYKRIDIKNPRRLVRSLEIIRTLGILPLQKRNARYKYIMIGIRHGRENLKKRIQEILDDRFKAMTKEIKKLLEDGVNPIWLDNLGLEARFVKRMLVDNATEEDTKIHLMKAIWAYAKRQEKWWTRYPETIWYYSHEFNHLFRTLNDLYYKKK